MAYPTVEQVEQASAVQLLRWTRYLPSPGVSAISKGTTAEFEQVLAQERAILDRILERQKELGGITPALSKAVGWR